MAGIAERLRARLQAQRENKNVSGPSTGTNLLHNSGHHNSIRPGLDLRGKGREECVANLKLAVALHIHSGRSSTRGDKLDSIFFPLVGYETGTKWFSEYCMEPHPDICSCGQRFLSNTGILRTHCPMCKGVDPDTKDNPTGKMEWRYRSLIRALELNYNIHPSWSEYAIAWTLAKFQVI